MKKRISTILLICIFCLNCSACLFENTAKEREIKINLSVNEIYSDLKTKLKDPGDLNAINDYLISWASDQNIPVSYDRHKNIIMSRKATHGHENDDSTLLQCPIGIPDIHNYEAVASTLFIIKTLHEHGFIRAIFTADPDEEYLGSSNISPSYLSAEKLISVVYDTKTPFLNSSAAIQNYVFSKSFVKSAPIGNHAYEIVIGRFPYDASGKIYEKHPNPIKELGDFFAFAKSKGIAIELVNFSGGNYINTYPAYAKATFVISDNDVTKFKRYFDKSAEKFFKSYEKLQETDPFVYTYTAISVPELVISREDSTQIFSLLYTMINGVFERDAEETAISNTTLSTISTEADAITLNVCARAKDESSFEAITNTLQIIATLNDTQFEKTNAFPAWKSSTDSEIYDAYLKIFSYTIKKELDPKPNLQSSPIAIFKQKNPNLDAICFSVNFSNNVMELEILEDLLSGAYKNKLP